MGDGLGADARELRLHQPHAAAGGAGDLAGRPDGVADPAPRPDHLRDQPALHGVGAQPAPGGRQPPAPDVDPLTRTATSASGWPTWRSSAATGSTAWPSSTPSCCAQRLVQRLRRDVAGALHRRSPTASRRGAGCSPATPGWPTPSHAASATGWATTSTGWRELAAFADDPELPGRVPRHQAGEQARPRDVDPSSCAGSARPGLDLRRAGQAPARVQAPAAQRHARHLRCTSGSRRTRHGRLQPRTLRLRRQGGARLPHGEAHHPADQRRRRGRQRRPRRRRQDPGRVSCPTTG